MYGYLYEHLSKEEILKLHGKHKDLQINDAMYNFFGEEGCCLADLCGDDMEEAEVLIHGIIRGLDHEDDGTEDYFIYSGGMKNLEIRKYFSGKAVKAIRAKTDLSQANFAKKVGLKPRTYQNYEEGQRIPSRLIVNAMKSAAFNRCYCVYSHRRMTLNLNELSELTQQYLEISMKGLFHFYWHVPHTRRVQYGDNGIRMYWVEADDRLLERLDNLFKTIDYFPEDLAACILCAKENDCDEIIFKDLENAMHGDQLSDKQEYIELHERIVELTKDLKKQKNKLRKETYQMIHDYLADEASGDPYKLLKWTEGLKEEEIEERRIKDKVKASAKKVKSTKAEKNNISRIK